MARRLTRYSTHWLENKKRLGFSTKYGLHKQFNEAAAAFEKEVKGVDGIPNITAQYNNTRHFEAYYLVSQSKKDVSRLVAAKAGAQGYFYGKGLDNETRKILSSLLVKYF